MARLAALVDDLAGLSTEGMTAAARIDLLTALEKVKRAAAAGEAVVGAQFADAAEHHTRLDAAAMTRRIRRSHSERRVSLRPYPDAMTRLTAWLPTSDGIACLTALQHAARVTHAAAGTATVLDRHTGQIAARCTGRAHGPAGALAQNRLTAAE